MCLDPDDSAIGVFTVFLFFFFLLEVGFTWDTDLPVGPVHETN